MRWNSVHVFIVEWHNAIYAIFVKIEISLVSTALVSGGKKRRERVDWTWTSNYILQAVVERVLIRSLNIAAAFKLHTQSCNAVWNEELTMQRGVDENEECE